MRETLTFLKTFLRHPTQVGAVAPSSPALVRMMVDWFDWENARGIVEFGPGTGVFTAAIEQQRHPDSTFFAIERSPEMAAVARTRCPETTIYEDSATNVAELCRRESIGQVDAIICGLPWASFSDGLQAEIIEEMLGVLRPGGQFATFAYWQGVILPAGRRFSRRLQDSFSSVQRSGTVWRNLPPAFVYRCVR
jgi:phospholipid N-methyltransferase